MQLGFREALFESAVRFHAAARADLVLVSPRSPSSCCRDDASRAAGSTRRSACPGVASVTPVYVGIGAAGRTPSTRETRSIFVVGRRSDATTSLDAARGATRSASRIALPRRRAVRRRRRGRSSARSPSACAPGEPVAAEVNNRRVARRRASSRSAPPSASTARAHQRPQLPAHLPEPRARPDRRSAWCALAAGRRPGARARRAPRGPARRRAGADQARSSSRARSALLGRPARRSATCSPSASSWASWSARIIVYQILFADVSTTCPSTRR